MSSKRQRFYFFVPYLFNSAVVIRFALIYSPGIMKKCLLKFVSIFLLTATILALTEKLPRAELFVIFRSFLQ